MPGNVFPAAAGYPQYSGTIVIPPEFSSNVLDRLYHQTILTKISTVGPYSEVKGDTIVIPVEPKVAVKPGMKDGGVEYDTLDFSTITLTLDQILQFGAKVAEEDVDMSSIDILGAAERAAAKAIAQEQDRVVMQYLFTQANAANVGTTAGAVTGNINLGSPTTPVLIANGQDLRKFLARMQRTLDEQAVPEDGRYIILPYEMAQLLMTEQEFLLIGAQGGYRPDQAMDGMLFRKIAGFTIYTSPYIPSITVGGNRAYYIVAGVPKALAYAAKMNSVKTINNDRGAPFDIFLAGRTSFGFGVVYDEMLAVGVASVDPAAL